MCARSISYARSYGCGDYIEGVAKQTIIKMDSEVYVRSSEFEKGDVVRFVESIVFHSYDYYDRPGIVYAIKLRGS